MDIRRMTVALVATGLRVTARAVHAVAGRVTRLAARLAREVTAVDAVSAVLRVATMSPGGRVRRACRVAVDAILATPSGIPAIGATCPTGHGASADRSSPAGNSIGTTRPNTGVRPRGRACWCSHSGSSGPAWYNAWHKPRPGPPRPVPIRLPPRTGSIPIPNINARMYPHRGHTDPNARSCTMSNMIDDDIDAGPMKIRHVRIPHLLWVKAAIKAKREGEDSLAAVIRSFLREYTADEPEPHR